jgi:hypothetical protein
MVRICLSPAESPCLTQTRPLQVEDRGLRGRAPLGWRRGRQRCASSSTSRQLPVMSLSASISVPQCREAVCDRGFALVRQAWSD